MNCSERLSQWTETVSRCLPHLSWPQARVLALWSFGMVFASSCGISQVSALLALVLERSEGTVRQRLREWLYGATDKKGSHRQEIKVTDCFGPLLRWVLTNWPEGEHRLALAMDATTLGQRFTVLTISVLVRGCAIPVAWKVLRYNEKGTWRPYWEALLEALEGTVPADWEVLVLADRGLYAPWLFEKIVAIGWHPFLRINLGCKAQREGEHDFAWIQTWVPPVGEQWSGRVECFVQKKSRLSCTLVLCRESGYEEPWAIVTDLPPEQVSGAWYRTKMLDVERAERLWLAMAVATLWTVSVGGQVEASRPEANLEALPPKHVARQQAGKGHGRERGRELSCVVRGRLCIVG